MQIPQLQTKRMFIAEHMHPQRRRRSKVPPRSSRWHLMIGKQRPTTQFKIRLKPYPRREVPLQPQWTKSPTVSRVVALEHHENRNHIDCVFESAIKKSRTMR